MSEVAYGPFPVPESWGWEGVAGVFVGGCVERGVGSSFRHQAHAHNDGEHRGWICVRSKHRVQMDDGRPRQVMLHEYAHIATGHGHDDVWRAKMREIGAPVEARYRKRRRRRSV